MAKKTLSTLEKELKGLQDKRAEEISVIREKYRVKIAPIRKEIKGMKEKEK